MAVALTTAGGLLVYTAVKNTSVVDGLRDVLGGRLPGTSGPPTGPAVDTVSTNVDQALSARASQQRLEPRVGTGTQAGQGLGGGLADAARVYLGRPYVWARAFEGGGGGDCSGLVVRALNDVGIHCPRLVTTGFLTWTGATTIQRGEMAAGDLVCWTGHIGIATSGSEMIHAPTFGDVVKIGTIWWTPAPVIRRVIPTQGMSAR